MGSENGDKVLQESPVKTKQEFQQKKLKITYSRGFLLSLSVLDSCKKLPSRFDASIPGIIPENSEFEDASSSAIERQRSLGGLSLQSSRRNDYGSQPLNRLDSSSSYSRGSAGKWDTHSSGSSDQDGDKQSDRDMQDSGSQFGNQPRRFWQHPEHDGLLGSGAFPRPSGYAGASAPRARGNDHYQLNRSSEPYQPPRPYKAVPYSRKDNTDLVNDETFGSSESTSEDRVEEERKRRALFELMRKEQQKALQDKKQNPDNRKKKLDTDFIASLEKSVDGQSKKKEEKSEVSVPPLRFQSDSSRFPSLARVPASRLLVPPGFASAVLEKNLIVQSSTTSIEAGHAVSEDNLPLHNDHGKKNVSDEGMEAFKDSVGLEDVSCKTSGLQEGNGILKDDIFNDISSKKEPMHETVHTVSQDQPASILEKLFGGALTKHNVSSPHLIEHEVVKADEETFGPAVSISSKLAHWFLEEEKRPAEDFSSGNLLSLIVSNEKVGSQTSVGSDDKAIEHILPTLPCENSASSQKLLSFSMAPVHDPYYQHDDLDSCPVVLTCEDLEQFILTEAKESSSGVQHSNPEPWIVLGGDSEEQNADIDDGASQHLLSLLQKGANTKESILFPKSDAMDSFDKPAGFDIEADPNSNLGSNATNENSEAVQSSEQTLLLEALFGAGIMKELQSVAAPLSTRRGSVDRIDHGDFAQPHGVPFPQMGGGIFSSYSGEYQSSENICEVNSETVCHTQEAKAHSIPGIWLGHEKAIVEGSWNGHFVEGASEIQLPEEDSLITVGDCLDPRKTGPSLFRDLNKIENLLPGMAPEEFNVPLLNTILNEGEDMRVHSLGPLPVEHGPYNLVQSDNLYHHLHGRPPSQFPEAMNNLRPLFPYMDHHINRNPQMKFMRQESVHHDPHHPLPPNLIPQHVFPNAAGPQFDPPAHHQILHHMAMHGNFPPRHPLQGLPRGAPLSHPNNPMPDYIPEMNSLHGFPLNNRLPNFGGPRMGMPGSVVGGGGNPEVLQRLIEMELSGNQKQNHPAAAGRIPDIFGPEFDMGFRYR